MQGGMNNSLQLMAVAFEFFGTLNNEQIGELLEGKVSLKLQTSDDVKMEALIEERLGAHKADMDGKLELLSQQIESLGGKPVVALEVSKSGTAKPRTTKPEASKPETPKPSRGGRKPKTDADVPVNVAKETKVAKGAKSTTKATTPKPEKTNEKPNQKAGEKSKKTTKPTTKEANKSTSKETSKTAPKPTPKTPSEPTVEIEPVIAKLKTLTTAKGFEEYFLAENFTRGTLQRITSSLGAEGSKKGSREDLQNAITTLMLQSN